MVEHVYHWKHGWIPLDHAAALSKSKGNRKDAKELLAAAHSSDAGIRSKTDLKGAIDDLHNVPSHDRSGPVGQIREAAQRHHVGLPGSPRAVYKHPTAGPLHGTIVERNLDSAGRYAPNGGHARIILDKDPGHKYLVSESRLDGGDSSSSPHREALEQLIEKVARSSAPSKYGASGSPYQDGTKIINGHRVEYRLNQGGEEFWFVDNNGPYRDKSQVSRIIGSPR